MDRANLKNNKMKLLIICGGEGLSSEWEISLRSGQSVSTELTNLQVDHDLFVLDQNNIPALENILDQYSLVWPIVHGSFGEDGQLQKILEQHNIPFVGSGSTSSHICFDKQLCKERLLLHNIPTPDYKTVSNFEELKPIDPPVFLKPLRQGSSIGTLKVEYWDTQSESIAQELLQDYSTLLAEEYISGTEITVGVLKDKALPIVAIIPPEGEDFDFENKYNGKTQEIVDPDFISEDIKQKAQALALATHQACNCKDYSRTDIIIRGEELFVLEINTVPGMTDQSLYPKMLKKDQKTLIDLITQG